MNKVFLGGTCNESTWRQELIPNLKCDYFDPVVEDWTPECQAVEIEEKEVHCNIHLYVITSAMIGVFSIAESVESAMTQGKICIFHVMPDGFDKSQIKSLKAVCNMISKHGGIAYLDDDIRRTARLLNSIAEKVSES